ncbi:MAG: hypothetical protein IKD01_05785 [Oscillospiraceae bacterium]|nr:hypothetical protein [Oscillospiraceae bacterium]
MNVKKRMYVSIFWIVLGFLLNVGCFAGLLDDFWQSMGVALMIVGALQMVRYVRYATSAEYRENMDIRYGDERNKFLANKAWAWAGYWYVLLAALGTIAFKIMGREDLMMFCSGSVCFMMVLYWLNYLWLSRKY